MEPDPSTIALLLLALAVLVQTFRLWWRSASRRWKLARRRSRGRDGEVEAEGMLERRGYRVVDRQVRARLRYLIDSEPRDAEVVADLLLSRGARRYIAEVKTGAKAPDPMHRATRRQLLEYSHAFDVDGLLLVDADTDTVRSFEVAPAEDSSARWLWLLGGVAVGLAAASLLA